jgi:hypothetical protein
MFRTCSQTVLEVFDLLDHVWDGESCKALVFGAPEASGQMAVRARADLRLAAYGYDGRHGGMGFGVPVGDDEDVVDLRAGEAGGFAVGLGEEGW